MRALHLPRLLATAFLTFCSLGSYAQSNSVYRNWVGPRLPQLGIGTSPRPAGGFYSEPQGGATLLGASALTGQHRVADDFEICLDGAFVNQIVLYAFSEGTPPQELTAGSIQIRRNSPTGTVVATGSLTQNPITFYWRIAPGAPNDNRRIRACIFTIPETYLSPDTYWFTADMRAGGGQPGPFATFLTKIGEPTTPGANAQQFSNATNQWSPILDGSKAQDLAFFVGGKQVFGHLFGTTINSNLHRVNRFTGAATLVGPIANGSALTLTAATYRPDTQQLFAVSSGSNELWQVNLDVGETGSTVQSQKIGDYSLSGQGRVNGTEWHWTNNQLYGITSKQTSATNSRFFTFNTVNGSATLLPGFHPVSERMEMVFRTDTNNLHVFDQTTSVLHRADVTSNPTILVNPVGVAPNPGVTGMAWAWDTNTLFATGIASGDRLWTINPTSGLATAIGNLVAGAMFNLVYVGEESVDASAFAITGGLPFGGNLDSLDERDNDKLYILCDENEPNGSLELLYQSCLRTAAYLHLKVETSCSRTDVGEYLDVFNWTTNNFVSIGFRSTTLTDSLNIYRTSNPSNQLYSEFGEAKFRLRWIPFSDLEISDGWTYNVDLARLTITPALNNN